MIYSFFHLQIKFLNFSTQIVHIHEKWHHYLHSCHIRLMALDAHE